MNTTTLLVGVKAINRAIKSIATRGVKLDNDIQNVALSAVMHAHDHSHDLSLFTNLCLALPKGSRVERLIQYTENFFPVEVDRKTFKARVMKKSEQSWDFAAAELQHWSTFGVEKEEKDALDCETLLAQLQRKADNEDEKKITVEARELAEYLAECGRAFVAKRAA